MMPRLPHVARLLTILVTASLLWGCGAAAPPAPPTAPADTPIATMALPEDDSWILVDLPPDATQLQHGAEIYRLVCSACHAHSGEGLTDAWRATWHPEDQNCWQSKCHAANHPPDGFELPIAPAVIGREALAPFGTAADLRAYIQATMPWQEPNSLTEDESWAVTAYVIKLNRMNPPDELNAETGHQYGLHPERAQATATEPATTPAIQASPWTVAAGILIVALAVYLALRAARRARTSRPS